LHRAVFLRRVFAAAQITFLIFAILFTSNVFAQATVTVSGTFTVPAEIIEKTGIDIVLIDLAGSTGFENFWADIKMESG
jgi:hypothetical protein